MAYEFQQALLPKAAPARWFVSAAAEMAPCQAIGGDFYDYLDFGETAVGFTIGDVAGKGVAAGLLGARVQEIFAACASPGIDPATTLAAINRVLVRRGLEARFVTLFFGVLRDDGRLAYCNAGHNPPLVIGRHGVRRLDRGGMILGLFQDATYECGDTVLEPGEALVAFSDGICEACNPEGEPFGDQRILDCITVHGHREEPRMLLEQLFAAVRHFSAGASPGDDMTGLIIRYCR